MRILEISSMKSFGGGEKHVADLSRGLKDRGHEVFFAARTKCEWLDKVDFIPAENRHIFRLRSTLGLFAPQRLARIIRENQIDIVHAHAARDYLPASIAVRIARETKCVVTRHVLFPMKPFQRIALGNVSKAIAVSQAVEKKLALTFPLAKIQLIYNGIDFENWKNIDRLALSRQFREFHSIPEDSVVIGIVGALRKLKGQQDFLLAAQEIAAKFPNAFFLVVGVDETIDKKIKRDLKRMAKVFGIAERTLFLDWIEEKAEMLSAIDIYVSASHTESFGLATLEAIAAGCLIVATETEGAREVVGGKDLVPIEDPKRLAEAIEKVITDRENAEKDLYSVRETAEQKFGLERMVLETEALFQSLLNTTEVAAKTTNR